MSIRDLTEPAAVLQAMQEHDRVGRDAFLSEHGFGHANRYLLWHGGRFYDSKAIAGVAYQIQHGRPIAKLSGGHGHATTALERLGFEIVDILPPWREDEMALALHTYLEHRGESLSKSHPAIVLLSERLRRLLRQRGTRLHERTRNRAGIAQQVGVFHRLDPESSRAGRKATELHVAVWERYAAKRASLDRRVAKTLVRLDAPSSSAVVTADLASEPDRGAHPTVSPEDMDAEYRRVSSSKNRRRAVRWDALDGFDDGTKAHEDARALLRVHLRSEGFAVKQGRRSRLEYDLSATRERLRLIIEVKSLPDEPAGQRAQLRLGLGQLLWYRHCYRAATKTEPVAVLMVEHEPKDADAWRGTCRDVDVVLTWPERFESLVDECKIVNGRMAASRS